jgi:hypothetical protein
MTVRFSFSFDYILGVPRIKISFLLFYLRAKPVNFVSILNFPGLKRLILLSDLFYLAPFYHSAFPLSLKRLMVLGKGLKLTRIELRLK